MKEKSNILIVEDNFITQKMVRVSLQDEGYMVFEANDAKTALIIAEREDLDLILQDLRLPDMDGYMLLACFRNINRNRSVPIVCYSGTAPTAQDLLQATSYFDGYLVKPVEPDKLISTIEGYLRRTKRPAPLASLGPEPTLWSEATIEILEERLRIQNEAFQALDQKYALQSSALRALNKISESLTTEMDDKGVLSEMLAYCLDTTGVPSGALFIRNDDAMICLASFGLGMAQIEGVKACLNSPLTQLIFEFTKNLSCPSKDLPSDINRGLLHHCLTSQVFLISVQTKRDDFCLLLLASNSININSQIFEEFCQTISFQFGQAITLIKSREAMLKTSRMKSEFMNNVSHEMRTPLIGMLGMTDALLDFQTPVEQRACLDIVKSCGENLLSLVNNILDFSKLESGIFNIDTHQFKLLSLLQDIISRFQVKADIKHISLTLDTEAQANELYLGDDMRLRQVLDYLLDNAIKFTEKGGVSLKITSTSAEPDSCILTFEIKDSGIGISAGAIDHIFDIFYQVDGSASRKYGGTGLGLSMAKRLTEAMGGSLHCTSALAVGSQFTLSMRLKKAIEHIA